MSLPELEGLDLRISSVMMGNKWSLIDERFLRLKFLKLIGAIYIVRKQTTPIFPFWTRLSKWIEAFGRDIGEITTLEFIHVEYCQVCNNFNGENKGRIA